MPQNEQFIKDVYQLVSTNGFQGSEEEALGLLQNNAEFQQDVLKSIQANGFQGELEDMLNLSGVSLPEKKNPDEPFVSPLAENATDSTEEIGVGEESSESLEESPGDSITNSYLEGSTLGISDTPMIESGIKNFFEGYEKRAKARSQSPSFYEGQGVAGLGQRIVDAAYNTVTNSLASELETTFYLNPKRDESVLLRKQIEQAKSEGRDFIVQIGQNRPDLGVGMNQESKISLEDAQKKYIELQAEIEDSVEGVQAKREESAKYQLPTNKTSDMFTPLGFSDLVGSQIPRLGASVVPFLGSFAQIYGDTYMTTLEAIAAKENGVDRDKVTPAMMIKQIEEGDDGQANSALSASIGASLDLIGLGKMANVLKTPINGYVKQQLKKGIQKGGKAGAKKALAVGQDILSASAVEGLTEGAQSAVQQIGTELAVDKTIGQAFNSLNWDQILKEGTAGALIGGPIGGLSSQGVKFNSSDVEAMIEENDFGAIQQFTQEGLIDWRTIPNKTRAKVGFTTDKVGDRTFTYPSTILNQDAVPPKVEVDVKEKVNIEEQLEDEQTTTDPTGIPPVDEGTKPNVEQVDAEAGLTAEESTDQQGKVIPQTGKPFTFTYNKNTDPAPDMGSEFGQDVEVAGDYVTQSSGFTPEGSETGTVTANSPLVIDVNEDTQISYKNDLSKKYKGRKGEKLKDAIIKDGYDAVVTRFEDGTTSEIVLLDNQRQKAPSTTQQEERDVIDDLRSPVEGSIEENVIENTTDERQQAQIELIENNGGTFIDENTEDIGILSGAIKATKGITSSDGATTKYVVVDEKGFNAIVEGSETLDPEEVEDAKTSNAYFNPKTQTVVYNKDKINETTEIHEVIHPVLESYMVNNQDQVNKMASDAITKDNSLLEFIEPYGQKDKALEAVVEGMARAAQADFDNKGSVRIKIKDFFDNLLDKAGFNRDVVIKGDETYVQLSRKLSDAFRRGRKIVVSDKAKSDGVGVTQKSSNPKVTKIRRQVRSGKKISKGLKVYKKDSIKVREEAPDLSLEYVRDNAPVVFIENAKAISQYDIIKKLVDFKIETIADAQKVYDLFSREIADNLKFLIDNFDPENRDFATLWYDGANVIAHEYAKQYKSTPEQVAGIIASLSPQKDWYQNVRLAELVLIAFQNNPTLGQSEIDYQIKINKIGEEEAYKKVDKAKAKYRKSRTKANKEKVVKLESGYNKKVEANNILVDRLSPFIGYKLSEVPNEYKKYFIRTFNEVNTTKDYNVLNPDGTVMGIAKNTNGKNSPVAWGSYTEIGKAVSVYLDGSARNITESLGEMHKIRNFYNNIIDPMSEDGDVTMDTHAVAAALLKAVSGNSEEVSHNFGANKTGSSIRIKSSAPNGIKGIYYAFQEGYKLAGKENNLLPRQVQSITWENIRSIFTKTFKNNTKNVDEINKIWLDYTADKINIDEARKRIVKYSGGFKLPTWARSGAVQERSGKDTGNESNRGGSLRDGQSTVGTSDRRDERGERSGIKFQKSPPTNSKEFKQWFGDSKVVEPNGAPSLMYHGTKEDFEEFDSTSGIFFTKERYVAKMYSKDAIVKMNEGTETIVPAYLRIESPIDIRGLGLISTRRKFINYVKSISGDTEFNPEDGFEGDLDDKVPVWEIITDYNGEFYGHLDEIGYDGIYIKDENDIEHESYIVWNANQAKHAAENNGDWSRNDSRLRFQKSIPKNPSIAKVRDFILDNEQILSTDLVYNSLKVEGVDEITVNQYRGIVSRLIDSTKKVNRKLQENGYKTKEAQREALKTNMNAFAEEIGTLNDFLASVVKIDRLKKVFQNIDTVKKFYKKGKLGELWNKVGFLTDLEYIKPQLMSDELFNKYSDLLNVLARKLKRGTITFKEIVAINDFNNDFYKENEAANLDHFAGIIAPYIGDLEGKSAEEFIDDLIQDDNKTGFDFNDSHVKLLEENKEEILKIINAINEEELTTDLEEEIKDSLPARDRQRIWEKAAEGFEEFFMSELQGVTANEFVEDYLRENLDESDVELLDQKREHYKYAIKRGRYEYNRNNLFSTLQGEIKATGESAIPNIISERERDYAKTILSVKSLRDLVNFENYEIKYLINSVRSIRHANWLPPVAQGQSRKINGEREVLGLANDFDNNGITAIMDDLEKIIPSFERTIREAIRDEQNTDIVKSKIAKDLAENVGIAKLGRMKSSAFEEFMNDFDAILASFQERLNIQEKTRNNLFFEIKRKTKKDGVTLTRPQINILIKMLQIEEQNVGNPMSDKAPKLSLLINAIPNLKGDFNEGSDQYQDMTAKELWKIFGNEDDSLNIAKVNDFLKQANALKYVSFLAKEAENNQSLVLHNSKYRRKEGVDIFNAYTPIRVRKKGGKAEELDLQGFFDSLTVKSKTSISRKPWDKGRYKKDRVDWDSYGTSRFAHQDVHKDYYLSEPYLDAYSTLTMLRGRLNRNGDAAISVVQEVIQGKMQAQFESAKQSAEGRLFSKTTANIKKSLLSSLFRPVKEGTANAITALSNWPVYKKALRGDSISPETAAKLAKMFYTSQASRLLDSNFYGEAQNESGMTLENLDPNAGVFKEAFQKMLGSKIANLAGKTIGFSDKLIGLPMWRARFKEKFEEVAQMKWQDSILDSDNLSKVHEDAIKEAMRSADVVVKKLFQGSSLYLTTGTIDSSGKFVANNNWNGILSWFTGFRKGQKALIGESWSVLKPYGEPQGSMTKAQAAKTVASLYAGQMAYVMSGVVLSNMLFDSILDALLGDDEEKYTLEEKFTWATINGLVELILLSSPIGKANALKYGIASGVSRLAAKTVWDKKSEPEEIPSQLGKNLKRYAFSGSAYKDGFSAYATTLETVTAPGLSLLNQEYANTAINSANALLKVGGVPFTAEVMEVIKRTMPKDQKSTPAKASNTFNR